ncbi:MAG: ArnT family glycosyltransferase [Candidatus Kapaibacterium sp.]
MLFDKLNVLIETKRKERITLLVVSLVVFTIQLLTLRPPVGIGEPYWIARYLAAGQGFSYAYPFDLAVVATCYIPPLYVWFHAAIIELGGGLIISQIAGLVFFHIANYYFYRFFRRITSPGIALAGFIALAFYVPLWLLAQKPDPDGLNLLLLALTILFLDDALERPRKAVWGILGILFGVQILVRPDILMGICFFGIWLLAYSAKGKKRKENFIGYCSAVGIALIMVLPWTIRNYNTFGSFVLVSANSGFNFYMGNNPQATGEFQQGPPTSESVAIDSARTQYFHNHPSHVERDSYLFQVGKGWILAHPAQAVKLWLKKFYFHWWQRDSAGGDVGAAQWMMTGYKFVSAFLLIFGFYGLFSLKSKAKRALLITLFLYSTAISVIFFTQSRHRAIKVDPYLVTLSIIGIDAAVKKLKETSTKTISANDPPQRVS